MNRPLLIPACALICGIALGYAWPDHRQWVSGAVAVCFAGWLICFFLRRSVFFIPALVFLCLGYLLIQPWAAPRFAPDHISCFSNKGVYAIVGRIDTLPEINHHRVKFNLSVQFLDKGNTRTRVSGKLRVTLADDGPALMIGDTIRLKGHIRPLQNFNNPGGFDYKRFMAAQRIWASVYARAGTIGILQREDGTGFPRMIREVRREMRIFLSQHAAEKNLGIFKTLLLGERGDLSSDSRRAFERAGIAHLFAISGLHIGIIGMVVFFLVGRVLSFIPYLLWRGWTKRGAVVMALMAVWGYGLLAGMSPSTQRAVCMITLFFLSVCIGRAQDLLNTIAAAAIVILLIDPPTLIAVSFQLSFAATGATILCLHAVKRVIASAGLSLWAVMQRKLLMLFFVSIAANLGTLPLVMMYFQQVSMIGVVSNLVFVPLIGFVVLPLALFAVCMLLMSQVVAAWLLWPADQLVSALLVILEKMAAWPFAAVMTIVPSPLEVCGYYVTIGLLISVFLRQNGRMAEAHRRLDILRVGIAACALILLADIGYWCYQRFWRNDLRVTVLDVGQGTANLLELPSGRVLLIDGGGFADNDVFDVGKNIIAPLLLRKKIRTVEDIVLSHPDSDHLNGLLYIAENFRVKRLMSNNESVDTKAYDHLKRIIAEKQILATDFRTSPRIEKMDEVLIKYLYPPADYMGTRSRAAWRTTNNNSLVVQVRLGAHAFLFPGDIERAAEGELVNNAGDTLKSDVLIAPHHGSRSSGTEAFLKKVQPRVVVFSAASRTWRPLPHPEALVRYRAVCERLYGTATCGAVCFSTNGRRLRVWTTKKL
ncbi:MAG: DNA internalization-related competence protein ComEC/Rec2 [Desulfobacterales bacterium]|jgi:competence protein ComEC|nr:DNA internalization-related competence protein ComEC/Rec2 [Desulfobacterales bacterium]